jgi:hypothetical protein
MPIPVPVSDPRPVSAGQLDFYHIRRMNLELKNKPGGIDSINPSASLRDLPFNLACAIGVLLPSNILPEKRALVSFSCWQLWLSGGWQNKTI